MSVLFLFEGAVIAGSLGYAAVMHLQNRRLRRDLLALDVAFESGEQGAILFAPDGSFERANMAALEFMPFFDGAEGAQIKLSDFLDYLYDSAAIEGSNFSSSGNYMFDDRLACDFRELVSLHSDGICLVRGRQLSGGQVLFTLNDISHNHKRDVHAYDLGRQNYHLSKAVEAITSGVLISNPCQDGNPVIFVNNSVCEFLQATENELLEAGWVSLLRMMKDQGERDKMLRAIEDEIAIEVEACRKVGDKMRWFSVKITPVKNVYGQMDLLVAVLNETTLLKQREAEFFQAQKLEALGQLSAGIAHDFNNILSIIDGFSVMMAGLLEEGDEKSHEYLKRIRTASQRGASLTRKMLTFSRHKVISQSAVDLCALLADQQELLYPLLGEDIKIQARRPDMPVFVTCNADSIGHIIMNLAINARDAMHGAGVLTIDLDVLTFAQTIDHIRGQMVRSDGYARLTIADTGTGMDEATRARIFDPFFTTKEQGKGTGLGMSVVYGLVREMGGVIDIASAPAKGTTMRIYIPLSDQETATRQIQGDAGNPQKIRFDGFTAMVAEDEDDLRMIVCQILEDAGMHVLSAENGNDALCLQDSYPEQIDILITDVVMPEMSGVKLSELFCAVRPEAQTIFMSGFPAHGDMAPASLPQGACFIAKPVNYDDLIKIVHQLLCARHRVSRMDQPFTLTQGSKYAAQ